MSEQYDFDEVGSALPDIKTVARWQHWVKTQVRVGIELEKEGTVQMNLGTQLSPSGSYDRLTQYNVVNVVFDGSVHGGTEVLVCGTNENFSTAHRKMVELHGVLHRAGLSAGLSAGMHYHLLAAQDDAMPEVILKNLYQLVRRYYAGLLYLTSTSPVRRGRTQGDLADIGITRARYPHFYSADHLGITPTGRTMPQLKQALHERAGRYCAFNMGLLDGSTKDLTHFQDGHVSRFHVEFRWPDSSDSPAQIVAQGFLFRALMMKAVELSRFGVMQADSDATQWEQNKDAVAVMTRGDNLGGTRSFDEMVAFAKAQARMLIVALRSHLLNIDGSSMAVLEEMVEKPVWQRRREGRSWSKVERQLMPRERQMNAEAEDVLRVIMLQQVTGADSAKEWKTQVAEHLGMARPRVMASVKRVEHQVSLVFDRKLGTYVVVW